MMKIIAILHPEEAAMVWTAMEAAAKQAAATRLDAASDAQSRNVPAERTAALAQDVSAETCAVLVQDVPAETRAVLAGDVPAETCAALTGDVPAGPGAALAGDVPAERHRPLRPSSAHRVPGRPAFDRADGLVAVAQAYLRGSAAERAPVEVIVTVSQETLQRGLAADPADVASTPDGACISAQAARRLACDAGIVMLVEDGAVNTLSVLARRSTTRTPLTNRVGLPLAASSIE